MHIAPATATKAIESWVEPMALDARDAEKRGPV
jgi:hypothetical protein